MVNSFYKFAEKIRAEAENVIKSELSKRSFFELLGFRLFMPLTVNILTDQGAVCLTILKDGSIKISEHLSSNPDSTIETSFETLRSLYLSRDKNQFIQAEREGRIKMTTHSWKGQQANIKLKELLGY